MLMQEKNNELKPEVILNACVWCTLPDAFRTKCYQAIVAISKELTIANQFLILR